MCQQIYWTLEENPLNIPDYLILLSLNKDVENVSTRERKNYFIVEQAFGFRLIRKGNFESNY